MSAMAASAPSTEYIGARQSEGPEAAAAGGGGEPFLLREVGHVEVGSAVAGRQVADGEDLHADAQRGPYRIEVDVEGGLVDGEFGEPHGHDPLAPPREKRQRHLDRA